MILQLQLCFFSYPKKVFVAEYLNFTTIHVSYLNCERLTTELRVKMQQYFFFYFFKKFLINYFKKWGKNAIFNNFYKLVFLLSTIGEGVKKKFKICTFVWCSSDIKKVVSNEFQLLQKFFFFKKIKKIKKKSDNSGLKT